LILDTCGEEQDNMYSDMYLKNARGFFVGYSVTDPESFQSVTFYLEQIHRVKGSVNVPIMLIGNKIDLSDERKVSKEEGKRFAEEHNMFFMEVSAKTGENVKETYIQLATTTKANTVKLIWDKLMKMEPINDDALKSKKKKCLVM
jgi:small GTP-binding protein